MKKFKRIFIIVIDSLGVGAMEDAEKYGDAGTDTLGHISQSVEEFQIPNLQKLGMANLHSIKQEDERKKCWERHDDRPLGNDGTLYHNAISNFYRTWISASLD